jgi:hypothetical protein
MINYIIQVILFQVLFLAIYDLFLSKETFFTKNIFYLLATPTISFLIPFIKIPTFQKAVPEEFIIYLPEIFLSPEKVIQQANWYQSINYVDVLFGVGVLLFLILFLVKLTKIINLIRKYKMVAKNNFTLVFIPKQTKAFSFFNYIFLGEEIAVSQREKIIAHELVHSKQKHSLDLLFFEVLKIIMWFNPMVYMYQKRITLIHEYISDEVASKNTQKENYINNLLSNFFQVENIAFINQFYKQSFIKKRIIMMTKKQSKKMNQLKYLVLIPVLVSMLFYTSCASKQVKKQGSESEKMLSKEIQIKELTRINQKLGDSIDKLNKEKELFKSMINFNKKKMYGNSKTINSDGSVSFMKIDKVPTYPGCETGDKKCFSKMVQKHFARNFDAKLPNTLGLDAGRKRVFIAFKIDREGIVEEIKVRAPHPKIKEEVLKVMSSLPKMIPGEHEGRKVVVKYSIPFTMNVE